MSTPQFSKGRRNRQRGLHRKKRSPETLLWERELLVPPQPPWMSRKVYARLADLRRELEGRP